LVCKKTLRLLEEQGVQMSRVHLFVPNIILPDGSKVLQPAAYRKALKRHNIKGVRICKGGRTLLGQCNRIMDHFSEGKYLVVLSDNIDNFVLRRSSTNLRLEPLPKRHLMSLTAHAFHWMRHFGCHTWSLGSGKNPLNMIAGTMSRKFGLLDGNCYGILNRKKAKLMLSVSSCTTDLEWSCRSWALDGGFFRYLHIAALKKYRTAGGLQDLYTQQERQQRTTQAIQRLAAQFPNLLRYEKNKEGFSASQPYRTLPKGPAPVIFENEINNRGRKRVYYSSRVSTSTERMRKHRAKHRA
jgi:hypothetical protein